MGALKDQIGWQTWAKPAWAIAVVIVLCVVVVLCGSKGVLFVRSIGIAGGIGLLATLFAIPIARVLMESGHRRRGGWVWVVALVPMWMPSYAIYGAMNLARAPDTIVGRWLIGYATSGPDGGGRRWAAIWAGYGIGILGLALWGSVIGAVVIAAQKERRASIYRDMMDLEPAGVLVRARVWVGLHRGALVRSWGVVTVVMLGSGVPLHLAQLETWSIVIWRELAQRGVDEWGAVWLMGLPMVGVGLVGAWFVTSMVLRGAMSRGFEGPGVQGGDDERRVGFVGAGLVWGLAVLVPVVVLGISIDDWRAVGLFWTERSDAIVHSVYIASVVGVIGFGFAVGVGFALGHVSRVVRGLGALMVFGSTAGALVPGVLVGAGVVQLMGSWWGSEIVGLLVRVLVVGGVVGAVVAGREAGELLSQRWSMGATGFWAWWRAHGKTGGAACLGAGVLCALLAVHEIEASVMMTRAGVSTLSQTLLADLHYARLERLSAALLNIMGVGIVVSLVGGWLLSRGGKDAG